jgi:lipoprotein-anchoring transpeptidase ErfK/SrfK
VARPTLHTSPGGSVFTPTFNGQALPAVNPTVFGNPLIYRVLAGAPGDAWAKVYVPARPNGTTAWVQTSQFQWGSSNRMLQINVRDRSVTVFEGSNVLISTSAVLGKSSSPTPLANGWVEEIMAGPSAAYGPRLISLGIFSDALNSFGGGVPKVALHGTNNPGLMGQYASNGCIRVPNDIINQIAGMLPLGSKVQIVG